VTIEKLWLIERYERRVSSVRSLLRAVCETGESDRKNTSDHFDCYPISKCNAGISNQLWVLLSISDEPQGAARQIEENSVISGISDIDPISYENDYISDELLVVPEISDELLTVPGIWITWILSIRWTASCPWHIRWTATCPWHIRCTASCPWHIRWTASCPWHIRWTASCPWHIRWTARYPWHIDGLLILLILTGIFANNLKCTRGTARKTRWTTWYSWCGKLGRLESLDITIFLVWQCDSLTFAREHH
jgi:Uri superfamily endonuclease